MSSADLKENVYNTLIQSAQKWPDHVAIVDEYGTLTFSELYEQTERLRTFFLKAGLQNTGLAVITKNSRHFIMGLYAGLACECVVMPLAHYQRPEEISKALIEARIHFVFSDQAEIASTGVNPCQFEMASPLFLYRTDLDLSELTVPFLHHAAVMRFTSGTTGDARCVILTHQSIIKRIEAANEGLQLSERDRVIWVLPMAYHFIVSIMLYIRYGVGIIICEDFLAESIVEKAMAYRGTFLYASPMHIRLLASSRKEFLLPDLKRVISTTTGISPLICKSFEEKFNLPVSQAFGIIEIGLPIINIKKSKETPEAVGYALPAFQVAILDENFKTVKHGAIGKLGIKGPGMFDAYLSPPKLQNEVLKEGWFVTGDLACMDGDGLIQIKGREKNMINVSGNKVFPDEVEEVINQFAGVITSKVYGQLHPLIGEIVTADVVLQNKNSFDQEELIRHCRQLLSSFKIPQRIHVKDHIEMTASGKIKRA